ncbi:MAG: DEAD/DEAH box helicase family protein [Puniceicoccales bacterium]|jgi:type I restriction enzyme R subunit|nr:DEAD/DEAH box helicase family protein [Puniceicoccales bacterium]
MNGTDNWNENTRVKLPALLHLTRLGWKYFSIQESGAAFHFDHETNIITGVFLEQFFKINPAAKSTYNDKKSDAPLKDIRVELGYDDLGRAFYKRLLGEGNSQFKLIDFENPANNTFHVCTELPCRNGEDEFRPDITLFVNGLPLAFVEVKKPNNPEGIRAEYERMNMRLNNEKFRKFINITQLLVFSNNMEYDDGDGSRLQGAFYATPAKGKNSLVRFNNFREQRKSDWIDDLRAINNDTEDFILSDTNHQTLKHSPEFNSNKNPDSSTNCILSSLFSKKRLFALLRFGIAYVDETDAATGAPYIRKDVMRYPQFFAAQAIERHLANDKKRGIIWHTQGSGKTALAFYSVKTLTNFYSKKKTAVRFYFIVDRLDLAKQTQNEFKKRGLEVRMIGSKAALIADFKKNTAAAGIAVVNIQKFRDDTTALDNSGYDISVQRIFFIDEAHRSYDPCGSFLANLYNADRASVKIALTGTPLIVYKERKKDTGSDAEEDFSDKQDTRTTRNIFGDYIHKYYYNDSIKDGFTLKLLREEIATEYKQKLSSTLRDIKVKLGSVLDKQLKAHKRFCEPLLSYILDDFAAARIRFGDDSIGGLVVCDSSEQARELFSQFQNGVAEKKHPFSASLILYNERDKETREQNIKNFKEGKTDFLFVYAMLLTGFDAPRLKKLYLGRKIKAHNLLQTLTRVNRPYRDFRLGYVVDFADITGEFERTNKAYFEELNHEYGNDLDDSDDPTKLFGSLFMSEEEIDAQLTETNRILSDYNTENRETFSQQISRINDRKIINTLVNALIAARELYNIARLLAHTDLTAKLDNKLLAQLLTETQNRLKLLSLKDALADTTSHELLNTAIEEVVFTFTKIGEEELRLHANDLQDISRHTRAEFAANFHKKDPEWVSLYEEFVRLLANYDNADYNPDGTPVIPPNEKKKMNFASTQLQRIFNRIRDLNRRNLGLRENFSGDCKYARVYKTFVPPGLPSENQPLFDILKTIRDDICKRVTVNENLVSGRGYFENLVGQAVAAALDASKFSKTDDDIEGRLTTLLTDEYTTEFNGR